MFFLFLISDTAVKKKEKVNSETLKIFVQKLEKIYWNFYIQKGRMPLKPPELKSATLCWNEMK